jgi:hypothetical protein
VASERGFLRDNAFLVAAVVLPVAVAGFFLLATAVPRWTVPLPQHDLVLQVERPYQDNPARVDVASSVDGGRVQATARLAPKDTYTRRWALLRFDHTTLKLKEIPVAVPNDLKTDEARTFVVEALAGVRVTGEARAPDGYELTTWTSGSGGLVGELFGMGRSRRTPSLVNRGRAVPLDLPSPFEVWYGWPVTVIGWVVGEGTASPPAASPGSR